MQVDSADGALLVATQKPDHKAGVQTKPAYGLRRTVLRTRTHPQTTFPIVQCCTYSQACGIFVNCELGFLTTFDF